MSESSQQDPGYAEEKIKRIMSRVALRRISPLVTSWRASERQKTIYAHRILVAIGVLIALLLFVSATGFFANFTNPKTQLFLASLLLGVLVGIVAVLWSGRGRK